MLETLMLESDVLSQKRILFKDVFMWRYHTGKIHYIVFLFCDVNFI